MTPLPEIVSPTEWRAAHAALLAHEQTSPHERGRRHDQYDQADQLAATTGQENR